MAEQAKKLTFVHLSDIHFAKMAADGASVEASDIQNEVLQDLDRVAPLSPTGVLVSGDIAYSGADHEYTKAREWLAKATAKLKIDPEDVWVIPGNHDINRQALKDSPLLMDVQRWIRNAPPKDLDAQIAKYLTEERTNPDLLFSPLKSYLSFASLFSCHHKPNQPIWTDDLTLNDGSTLRLVGLNSTLVSNATDDDGANKLVVGMAQLQFQRVEGVEYLVMCHHPPQWLRDQDTVEDYLKNRVRLQLFGHKHRQRLEEIDRKSIKLAAGAMFPDKREPDWIPTYNVIQLHVTRDSGVRYLNVRVEPRVWTKDLKFGPDSGEVGGVREFKLELAPWTPPPGVKENKQAVPRVPTPITQPEHKPMNIRRLAYRFLSLPYTKQIEIAQRLGLLKAEDKGLQDQQLFQLFFERAREQQMVELLERTIDEVRAK
jgi:calcineurin-like phosphoesterase family protein